MSRQVKCPICNTMNDKEQTEHIGNRYYCKQCAIKKKQQTKKNTDGWDELFQYICKLYNIPTLTAMMFKQIKDFRNEPYNFTNIGMYLTLRYYYETLNHEVKEDAGLGIIPYYYDRAEKQYIDVLKIQNHIQDFQVTEKESTIQIKKSKIEQKEIHRKQKSYDNIQWEDDDAII